MQLVKLITPKKINTLRGFYATILVLLLTAVSPAFSQDNSPYSRYGIGDLVPPTNIITRGMGGVSAGYVDYISINFNNPASYAYFQGTKELKSKKLTSGRAILDIGINVENRKLTEPATSKTFTASNALFSYVQVGLPLKENWGLSFGLRPMSRISYKMFNTEKLINPNPPFNPIDSALTRFEGDGGSYLASMGTGISIIKRNKTVGKGENRGLAEENLSIGVNAGYLFGEKNYNTRRSLLNDTVEYYQANYETKANFGNLYFNAGIQYKLPINKLLSLTLGAYGNIGHQLNATQDILRETFVFDGTQGEIRLDSVSDLRDVKGKIELPASYTFGFVLQKLAVWTKEGGWLIGVDYMQQNWSEYRYYGQTDQLQNKWELRVGGQLSPTPRVKNYFSNVAYRFGFFTGTDYVNVGSKLGIVGGSFGFGLPLGFSRQAPNQNQTLNLAFEYSKRGNNDNLLRENMFRISIGFSLSDAWFIKRKYD